MEPRRRGEARMQVQEVLQGRVRRRSDLLAVEEPLEIRLWPAGAPRGEPISVTMRTPGHDFALAAGFLYTEGIVAERAQIARISYCVGADGCQEYNVVNVMLRAGWPVDLSGLQRNFYTTSSCGICGKASIEAVARRGLTPPDAALTVEADVLAGLPQALRRRQTLFAKTGGLHAAALFDPRGELVVLREDVGRHNAVDKVIGERLLAGAAPLAPSVLLVSGRASFEIAQKAVAAGIPALCAVSAPSSLAVDLCREFGVLLVGFLRPGRFNVYAGGQRLRGAGGEAATVSAAALSPTTAPSPQP